MSRTQLITKQAVADQLGLAVRTIERMVLERRINYVKITGKAIRFRQEDIEKMIERRTVKAKIA